MEGADEAAIWEAARLANALEFYPKLNGFETKLGERGSPLIWRPASAHCDRSCLLRNPDILILMKPCCGAVD